MNRKQYVKKQLLCGAWLALVIVMTLNITRLANLHPEATRLLWSLIFGYLVLLYMTLYRILMKIKENMQTFYKSKNNIL